ncbi:hypothetical protein PsorP6_012714 [Peronosclerospora sorghi]|uniref:Uncharacterized protein n=1 Tax=Peronosclerospora sorghi TaxID=230839 RepID=A0ACC0WGQ4_9STRA|nr:hypothetical protein PsorP6_012714 [Peronosclerospora sorghi]
MLLEWVLLLLVLGKSHAACSRDVTTLTSTCPSDCYDGRPCIAFASDVACNATKFGTCVRNATLGTADVCPFECFRNGPDDFAANGALEFTQYVFFIPFGNRQSNWEANWTRAQDRVVDTQLANQADETEKFPSESNLVLQHLDPLTFSQETTEVMFVGGTSFWGVRGKVSEVHLSPEFLASNTQLTSITMLNLGFDVDPPQSTFPTQNVETFRMSNCLLNTYPADLEFMTSVVHVDFSKNYFQDYPVKFSHETIETLNLSTNALTACSGDFPSMKNLDLSGNTLTHVPANIFDMPKLQVLNLSNNAFTDVTFSPAQVAFLKNLDTLTIDTFGDPLPCPASAQVEIHNVSVCVDAHAADKRDHAAALGGGLAGALGVAVACSLGFWWYRRRRRPTKGGGTTTGSSDPSVFSSSRAGVSLWNDQALLSLQLNPDDLQDVRKLGTGAFGVVVLATYRQKTLVACKRLKKDVASFDTMQQFIAEVKLCATLDHPRIVHLVGVAWTIESDFQAIFEYMAKGDLRTFLETTKSGATRWTRDKLQLAIDLTDALVYVHSFTPPIVHRDLKSRNVLLSDAQRAHLSDFGIARVRSSAETMTSGVGTGRWLAPEVIAGDRDYDETSDIFALGVVLSELDTHCLPYHDARGTNGNLLADVAILQLVALGKLLPSFRTQCPLEIQDLARRCMAFERTQRPTAVEVAFALRTLQKSTYFE